MVGEGLGLQAFEGLRAEVEPWLDRCFVSPPHLDMVRGLGSFIVYGDRGSGKTALCRALLHPRYDPDDSPHWLRVQWQPALAPAGEVPTASLFRSCGEAVLEYLLAHVREFRQITPSGREILRWWIHRCDQNTLDRQLKEAAVSSSDMRALAKSPGYMPRDILQQPVDTVQAIRFLLSALREMGIAGVRVVVDVSAIDQQQAIDSLTSLLSNTPLFRDRRFAFKIIAPADAEPSFQSTLAVLKRAVEVCRLGWDFGRLREIVVRRLACATGRESFTLADLYEEPETLLRWLERAGGNSPREWLYQVYPLVAYYLGRGLEHPVDKKTRTRLRREHPPYFYLDEAQGRVIVGARERHSSPGLQDVALPLPAPRQNRDEGGTVSLCLLGQGIRP